MLQSGALTQLSRCRNWKWCSEGQQDTVQTDTIIQSASQGLNWETLESRWKKIQLTMLFKIINDLVDIPAEDYLMPSNTRIRAQHSKKLRQYSTKTDTLKLSFFPRIIPVWNSLQATVAEAPDLVFFKQGLSTLTF